MVGSLKSYDGHTSTVFEMVDLKLIWDFLSRFAWGFMCLLRKMALAFYNLDTGPLFCSWNILFHHILSLPRGLWENTFAIALSRNPTPLLVISWFARVCLRSAITEVFFLFLLTYYAKLRYDCLCFQMRKNFKFSAILWILCEFYVCDYKVFSVDWFLARNLKNEQMYLHTNQRFRTWTELNLEHPWCSDRNGMYGSIY